MTTWKRIASGDYENGQYRMWQVPDVYPPAWNVEDTDTGEMVVDGAATMRDAKAIHARCPNCHGKGLEGQDDRPGILIPVGGSVSECGSCCGTGIARR